MYNYNFKKVEGETCIGHLTEEFIDKLTVYSILFFYIITLLKNYNKIEIMIE